MLAICILWAEIILSLILAKWAKRDFVTIFWLNKGGGQLILFLLSFSANKRGGFTRLGVGGWSWYEIGGILGILGKTGQQKNLMFSNFRTLSKNHLIIGHFRRNFNI